MLHARIRSISTVLLLLSVLILGSVIGSTAANAASVDGTWNTAKKRNAVITFDALSGGRTAVLHSVAPGKLNNMTSIVTAYTPKGQKLWTVDMRKQTTRPTPLKFNGLTTFTYNRDMQKMRTGWIMQICVRYDPKIGKDVLVCAKNKV